MVLESWTSGDAYEAYVGRWSRVVARDFLAWLGIARGRRWLDVGCGTGALSEAVVAGHEPAHLYSLDRAFPYAQFARRRLSSPGVSCVVADAQAVPLAPRSVDVVVSGLMLNFVPQPALAVAEMARVLADGGVAAVYVWDYAGGMQFMRYFWDAAVALDAAAESVDEGRRFSICQPDALEALFRAAGFGDVETRAVDVPTRIENFDDYWTPFLGAQGSAPGYVSRLDEAGRVALRERLRASLPTAADGSIPMIARAWAVKGAAAPRS